MSKLFKKAVFNVAVATGLFGIVVLIISEKLGQWAEDDT